MKAPQTVRRDWGESAALLVTLGLFFAFPNRYTIGGDRTTLFFGLLLAVMCALSIFLTIAGTRKYARMVMTAAAVVLTFSLLAGLAKIVYLVVYHASDIEGTRLLESALVIWISNVVTFAVFYHWAGEDEFTFPRAPGDERPMAFLDYLFLSFTTSTAFSPTDTPPLSTRARMLMMLESIVSLATIVIAAARAINILH